MIDIQSKKDKLAEAAAELKKEFFGIDETIDKIIDNISAWYLFPELSIRPHIVCLWGLTGVGKTDLIRKLCMLLDINSAFCEIQLDGNSNSTKTIGDILSYTTITPDSHGVLLLDEVQRFKTKDEDGHAIRDGGMQDLWMLLSDGTLGSRNALKSELRSFAMELDCDIYDLEQSKKKAEAGDEDEKEWVDEETNNPWSWSKKNRANKLYRFDSSISR